MASISELVANGDRAALARLALDFLHRIVVHYGQWQAEVAHQLGRERALAVEERVWPAVWGNHLRRLGAGLGFAVEDDAPAWLLGLSAAQLGELVEKLAVNWLAADGIWFQAVEREHGMDEAKRANDTCWSRFSPFEARRIRRLLDLPERGGLPALKSALGYRLYAALNRQAIVEETPRGFVLRMEQCRVQVARRQKGLPDYPCRSAGLVEYRSFAEAVDPRIATACVACPPDPHPSDWFCAWRFTLDA